VAIVAAAENICLHASSYVVAKFEPNQLYNDNFNLQLTSIDVTRFAIALIEIKNSPFASAVRQCWLYQYFSALNVSGSKARGVRRAAPSASNPVSRQNEQANRAPLLLVS
jgi:hypothetical protein